MSVSLAARSCLILLAVSAVGSVGGVASAQVVADDLGVLPRYAGFAYPTRLLNVYFPEATVGYRWRFGSDGLWAVGGTAGAGIAVEQRRGAWGYGFGLEARRYWFDSPPPRVDPYFALGAELSRAHYDAELGLEPVPGTGYDRVAETGMVSRRREGLAGLGAEFTAGTGFVVDVRLCLALTHWDYRARALATAPEQIGSIYRPNVREAALGFLDDDNDRADVALYPRLRVGFGWRW